MSTKLLATHLLIVHTKLFSVCRVGEERMLIRSAAAVLMVSERVYFGNHAAIDDDFCSTPGLLKRGGIAWALKWPSTLASALRTTR